MYREQVNDVFFDLDHTLWDFETNSAHTFQELFESFNIPIALDLFLKHYIPINFQYWKLYREKKIEKEALRYSRLKDSFDALDFDISDTSINQLSDGYIEILPTYNALFPGTVEILEYLKDRYQLHIITNGFEEIQEKKLHQSGIRSYFHCIINSEMAGVKKPDPYIFNLAMQQANATANQSVMIGDNLEADIQGAKNVGMHTLHFNSNAEKENKEIPTIYHLNEINRYL